MNISNKTQKLLILSGVIGPIFFFTLLTILGLIWKDYNPILTGMSYIYMGFSLLGISIVIFGIGFKAYFKKNLQMTIAYILLLIGGIFMFAFGFFPCDPQCIDVTQTGRLHSLTSTIPAILIPFAAMLSAYPISKAWGKKWGYTSFFLGVLSMTSGPIMFIEYLNNYTGLIQRLGIGFSLFWIFITSIKIYEEIRS